MHVKTWHRAGNDFTVVGKPGALWVARCALPLTVAHLTSFLCFLGLVGFNGLDMMRMKEDKFECVDRTEGLHADVSTGCQVRHLHICTNLQFPLFNKYLHLQRRIAQNIIVKETSEKVFTDT